MKSYNLTSRRSRARRHCTSSCSDILKACSGCSSITTKELSTGDGTILITMHLWSQIWEPILSETFWMENTPLPNSRQMSTAMKIQGHIPHFSSCFASFQSRASSSSYRHSTQSWRKVPCRSSSLKTLTLTWTGELFLGRRRSWFLLLMKVCSLRSSKSSLSRACS